MDAGTAQPRSAETTGHRLTLAPLAASKLLLMSKTAKIIQLVLLVVIVAAGQFESPGPRGNVFALSDP